MLALVLALSSVQCRTGANGDAPPKAPSSSTNGPVPKFGYQIVAGSPEQITARLHAEIAGVKDLVARAGIKPEN